MWFDASLVGNDLDAAEEKVRYLLQTGAPKRLVDLAMAKAARLRKKAHGIKLDYNVRFDLGQCHYDLSSGRGPNR